MTPTAGFPTAKRRVQMRLWKFVSTTPWQVPSLVLGVMMPETGHVPELDTGKLVGVGTSNRHQAAAALYYKLISHWSVVVKEENTKTIQQIKENLTVHHDSPKIHSQQDCSCRFGEHPKEAISLFTFTQADDYAPIFIITAASHTILISSYSQHTNQMHKTTRAWLMTAKTG